MSKANQKSVRFGFYCPLTAVPRQVPESQMDLIDMNGDRFPDLVAPGGNPLHLGRGTFFESAL